MWERFAVERKRDREMALLGARPKSRDKGATRSTHEELPAGRLDQLMTFVEKAAASATPVVVPDFPPRLVQSPRADAPTRAPLRTEALPAITVPSPPPSLDRPEGGHRSIEFPEPILVMPQRGAGKRRREPLLAS